MRKFLSYLPTNVYEQPPVLSATDPVDREEEELLSIVPRNRAKIYSMRRVIELLVDHGDYFEIQPDYGKSLHTVLARVGGFPFGIVANNPAYIAGAMSAESADKSSICLPANRSSGIVSKRPL